MIKEPNFDFSFSGLKTAAALYIKENKIGSSNRSICDFAASFQNAIVQVLFRKTIIAAKKYKMDTVLLAGGVAANSELREVFDNYADKYPLKIYYPSSELCTDNAAMIAVAGIFKYKKKQFADLTINASSLKGLRQL
jgi:N6-L-threonylcarbamoyladenine synthase